MVGRYYFLLTKDFHVMDRANGRYTGDITNPAFRSRKQRQQWRWCVTVEASGNPNNQREPRRFRCFVNAAWHGTARHDAYFKRANKKDRKTMKTLIRISGKGRKLARKRVLYHFPSVLYLVSRPRMLFFLLVPIFLFLPHTRHSHFNFGWLFSFRRFYSQFFSFNLLNCTLRARLAVA